MRTPRLALAVPLVAIFGVGGGAGLAMSGGPGGTEAVIEEPATPPPPPPPNPPWVNDDGTVDVGRLPETVGVAAFDGTTLRDATGREVRLPYRSLHVPRPDFTAQSAQVAELRRLQVQDAVRRGIAVPAPVVTREVPTPIG